MLERPPPIPQEIWERLARQGRPRRVAAGELLWVPGAVQGDTTYVVTRGLVRLYHPGRKGDAVTLLAVGPGGLLGHHPELRHAPHLSGAEALVSGTLVAVPADVIDRWLGERGAFGEAFTAWLLRDVDLHLGSTYARLELGHTPAPERVARTLLALDQQALLDRVSRQQIADLANLTVETTVRTLSSFLRAGTLTSSHFTRLSERELHALSDLLAPFEPPASPYT